MRSAETHNERMKAFYAQRRAAGLCRKCGQPAEGKALCPECHGKRQAELARRREQRAAAGVCLRCTLPLEDKSKRHCADCRRKFTRRNMEIYNANLQAGRCAKCGGPRVGEGNLCVVCSLAVAAASKKRKEQRWAAAECYRCSAPLENLAYRQCRRCLERYRSRRQWQQDWRVARSLSLIGRRILAQARGDGAALAILTPPKPRDPAPSLSVGWKIAVALAEAHKCRQCRDFLIKARLVRRKVHAPIRRRMMKRLLRSHER